MKNLLLITMLLGAGYSQDCGDGFCDFAEGEYEDCPEDCGEWPCVEVSKLEIQDA